MHLESGKYDSIRTEQLTRSGEKSKLIDSKPQFRNKPQKTQAYQSKITVEVHDLEAGKGNDESKNQSTFGLVAQNVKNMYQDAMSAVSQPSPSITKKATGGMTKVSSPKASHILAMRNQTKVA